MEISIREMKNCLSKYLKLVQTGKDVVITNRGRPVARLTIFNTTEDGEAQAIRRIQALPWVRSGNGRKIAGSRRGVRLRGQGPMAADIVLQDRE